MIELYQDEYANRMISLRAVVFKVNIICLKIYFSNN